MSDLTGQRLGQYQILARISKGSTSTIYKAYQPKLDRFVAIKVLSPQIVDEENFFDRFTQEARAVAQLDHPNIVPVYDFDRIGDIAYIVLKYVESGTLRKMMSTRPMDLGLAVDIVSQVGLALGYAHKRGVIHRDVKPSNILIGEGHWAMLTDFGLAKILGGGRQLTRSGIGLGTPDYMSPEQAQGIAGDGRADLYSLGVTFYEMITGRVPFEADSSMGVIVKHITEPAPLPTQFNSDLPAGVENVILRAMEKDPERRFQTAEAMIAALTRAATPSSGYIAARNRGIFAWAVARSVEKPDGQGSRGQALGPWQKIKRASWDKLSRGGRAALGGVAVVVLALLLWRGTSPWIGTPAAVTPALATSVQIAQKPTRIPALPAATASPVLTTPTAFLTPAATLTFTPTPGLILLNSSAKIRQGIYVKVVRPQGFDLMEEPGFDKNFIMTIPTGTTMFVIGGPSSADTLSWIRVSVGDKLGWGVQDYVVAYAMRAEP